MELSSKGREEWPSTSKIGRPSLWWGGMAHPPHGGGADDGVEDAMGRGNLPTSPSGSMFFFLLQGPTKDGFELRAQCKTTAHCGRGGVELAVGDRERRNDRPLEPNF